MKLKPDQLRKSEPTPEHIEHLSQSKNDIYIILDNVLDTYNVGAIFRLADALNVRSVYLCGATETPPNSRIKKASINTTEWVDWQYFTDAKTAILNIKNQFRSNRNQISNIKVIAIEQSPNSIAYDRADYSFPIALVVGHESLGVSEEVLNMCDQIVEIPMFGINTSLNVMVSLGIVLYEVIEKNNASK